MGMSRATYTTTSRKIKPKERNGTGTSVREDKGDLLQIPLLRLQEGHCRVKKKRGGGKTIKRF